MQKMYIWWSKIDFWEPELSKHAEQNDENFV